MHIIKLFAIAFMIANVAAITLTMHTFMLLDDDAVAINLAGRQRMLSQRMTKASMLTVEQKTDEFRAELRNSAITFDSTLRAFIHGGKTAAAGGEEILIPKLSGEALAIAEQALRKWDPVSVQLLRSEDTDISIKESLLRHNSDLLNMMNKMTIAIEKSSKTKVSQLRLAQSVLFGLAIILGIIVFVSLSRQAKAEATTSRALLTAVNRINAGVLIVDGNGIIRHFNAVALKILDMDDADPTDKPLMSLVEGDNHGGYRISRLGKKPQRVTMTISPSLQDLNGMSVVTLFANQH